MRTLYSNDKGSVLPLVAIGSLSLLSFAALALDVGYWYSRSTKISNIADASAISAATALLPLDATNVPAAAVDKVTSPTGIAPANADSAALKTGATAAVKAADVEFGYWDSTAPLNAVCSDQGGSFAAGTNYPGTINGLTTANAVRIWAHHANVPMFLAKIFTNDSPLNINRCAVAERDTVLSCFYIMNPNAGSWSFNGNMTVNSNNCGIANNGTIDGNGKSNEVYTDYVCTDTGTDGNQINVYNNDGSTGSVHACPDLANPYASQAVLPSPYPANNSGSTFNSTDTLSSGTYKGNIDVNNGETLTLSSGGTYVFNGSSTKITIKNGGKLVGNNVTIILSNGATIDAHNGDMTVSARTGTGDFYDGKVIIQNDGAGNSSCGGNNTGKLTLGGNGNISVHGVVYLKDYTLEMQGTPSWTLDGTSFVVCSLDMGGGGNGSLTISPAVGPRIFTNVRLVQ